MTKWKLDEIAEVTVGVFYRRNVWEGIWAVLQLNASLSEDPFSLKNFLSAYDTVSCNYDIKWAPVQHINMPIISNLRHLNWKIFETHHICWVLCVIRRSKCFFTFAKFVSIFPVCVLLKSWREMQKRSENHTRSGNDSTKLAKLAFLQMYMLMCSAGS